MRVFSRIALTLLVSLVLFAPMALASHFEADCPLQLVASSPPVTAFGLSPHGAFRYGSQFFILRGQALTTYVVSDLGDLQTNPRQDFLGTLGAREANGGVTFNNGFLFVSSDAGLEIFDLRGVRAGGSAPSLVSRTAGLHYRRLAVSGNVLAGVFPATDYPCYVGGPTVSCSNSLDIFDISNLSSPLRVAVLSSVTTSFGGFNDVAFNYGFLVVTAQNGTGVYDVSNPALPTLISSDSTPGTFLVSNGGNLVGVGNDASILTLAVVPPGNPNAGQLIEMFMHTLATLRVEHANPIMFHPQATFDEQGGRLITMVDELDPQTLQPARTFAFDVFDYAVPMFEGKDPRQYEQVSYTQGDEVKYNPLAIGANVYVVGEISGLQQYGACGQMVGRIDWYNTAALPCGGAQINGWITGMNKISNVEILLDGGSLGSADMSGPLRTDIPSTTPVQSWRINVILDNTSAGNHLMTAIGTDINGNRRQFASQRIVFKGPGQNCYQRRRTSGK